METIQNLINQVFEKAKNDDEDLFSRNIDLADRLKLYRWKVVDPILSELLARKTEGKLYNDKARGSPVFHLIDVMTRFATPKHAQQLAEMLLWDEVAITECRSARHDLLGRLKRIGDASVIPLLTQFGQNVEKGEYTDGSKPITPAKGLLKYDLRDVEEAITACQQRSPVPSQIKS